MKGMRMKQKIDMLKKYDFSGGIRGKYAKRYAAGTNIVILSPDIAGIFPDSKSVNEALRTLAKIAGKRLKITASA